MIICRRDWHLLIAHPAMQLLIGSSKLALTPAARGACGPTPEASGVGPDRVDAEDPVQPPEG